VRAFSVGGVRIEAEDEALGFGSGGEGGLHAVTILGRGGGRGLNFSGMAGQT
jgi:hypothetical protein